MHRIALVAIVVASALAVVACGSSSKKTTSSATSAPAQTQTQPAAGGGSAVALQADPGGALKFTQSHLTAKAGKVTIKFTNPAPLSHGVSIQGAGVNKPGQVVGQGGTTTLTVDLKPGTYTYYCPVPGHRQAGMQGTLTVQ